MTPIQTKNKRGDTRFKFSTSEEIYREHVQDYSGFCIGCGEQHDDNCEPDARKYQCSSCQQALVYGTEELLVMGYIAFNEGEEE